MVNLDRFKKAYLAFYNDAKNEIEKGRKTSHWMWFIFPQLRGLGDSEMSSYYGLENLQDAVDFFNDEYLGECFLIITKCVLRLKNYQNVLECFGPVDTVKLHASMTLFHLATQKRIFKKVLKKIYNGSYHQKTVLLVAERICKQ